MSRISEAADRLSRELPGYRVEILQGRLTATPHADGTHALILTELITTFHEAGARQAGLKYLQAIGLWLPSGPDDFAIPDLSLVAADFRHNLVESNCYAPHAFRMVAEVTGPHWSDDLGTKTDCYAQAGIPVYLVADRRHDEAVLHTDPRGGEYRSRKTFKRGTSVPLPESLGITLELPVDRLLDGDEA
ncbi:Uma2 family endonuclease [Streptomyces sp. APSN-46.1]|uniref:Uma2 family endonuclease n=1 Tax=Streptomyces sp. APSN-46.1 TaxID=2929049 RepID=UPI001FB44CC7|nr:Uma2 family endonuclease [Streptomyces sp. APSN-46.1]MCJ1679227.1 Uma2 family endonuclease [Streptomyces sp. APSN-46.1]